MSLLYKLALPRVKGVGNVLAKQLLEHCGNAEEVFRASKKQLLSIPGIGEYIASNIIHSKEVLQQVESELLFVEKHKISVLFWKDDTYPLKLKECLDAPVILYYKGNADLNTQRIMSVVGTRKASDYGKKICQEFVAEFQGTNVLVVSGLAHGIDSHIHKACVKNNIATVGVLGHGLDRIYPTVNRTLALEMLQNGGLLTEYPSGTIPDKQNFPARNRIIAGLADVTVVVEAAKKGGALITAEIANTYNRDVCAFPGDIYKEFSSGCNHLIKTHRAHLIHSANDLAYLMNWTLENVVKAKKQVSPSLDGQEESIYRIIQHEGPIGVDQLSIKAKIAPNKLAFLVLSLEMKGIVVSLPGKVYRIP